LKVDVLLADTEKPKPRGQVLKRNSKLSLTSDEFLAHDDFCRENVFETLKHDDFFSKKVCSLK